MTAYALEYTITPDLQRRAMVSWAKQTRTRGQKTRALVLGALAYVALVAALVALMQYDLLEAANLVAAAIGFLVAIAFWWVMHRIHTAKIAGFADDALARYGPVIAEFRASEVKIATKIATSMMTWVCFDAVIALPDATVLRAGALVYAIPDAALPEGTTPQAFRADLTKWMEAAR